MMSIVMLASSNNQDKMRSIRRRMQNGELTYEQAKDEAQPILEQINATAKQLALKYNLPPRKVSFAELIR